MQLTLSAKPLAAHLKSVLPAAATRSGLPLLSGVRLEAGGDGLIIEATDLELTARRTIRDCVTVGREGSVVAPAKALIKAVAAMDEPDVTLASASDDGRCALQVRAGARSVTLQGWRPEEWPSVPRVAGAEPIACVDASAAADALERAALCASGDKTRPVLTSIALYFGQDPPCLEVVATDSYRLGVTRIGLQSSPRTGANPLLLPARAIRPLAKQLRAAEGTLDVAAIEEAGDDGSRASRVGLALPDTEWTVRTVEGEFPNWRQVIPEPSGAHLEFDAEELSSGLRAAASVRSSGGGPVRLTLDRTCSLALVEPDLGEMRQVLSGASFSPNGVGAIQVAFNPGYLADAIRFCGTPRGRMWVRDGLKPALFEGPDRRYALMPVRMP